MSRRLDMGESMTPPPLADRIHRVEPSGTVQLTATLQRLRARGVDVIDWAVGEPDFAVASMTSGAPAKSGSPTAQSSTSTPRARSR